MDSVAVEQGVAAAVVREDKPIRQREKNIFNKLEKEKKRKDIRRKRVKKCN